MGALLLKFNQLDAFQKQEVLDFLDFLLYKKQQPTAQEKPIDEAEKRREAAALLLNDYQNDKDLIVFTVLDSDDFYETK